MYWEEDVVCACVFQSGHVAIRLSTSGTTREGSILSSWMLCSMSEIPRALLSTLLVGPVRHVNNQEARQYFKGSRESPKILCCDRIQVYLQ